MPVYVYACSACGHEFQELHKVADRNIPCDSSCPKCNELKVSQKILPVGFVYNRSGAVKTDDTFNDRMKEIRKNTPYMFRDNLDQSIR